VVRDGANWITSTDSKARIEGPGIVATADGVPNIAENAIGK